ncbi:hypothetical protein L2E82_10326 [Cichorium intybus]|uniref:Uncharacterized protein n=1 Tax=Cichorium intybus TaxID=13427 RepID=A0ACB9GBB5_CICIN|nr:hypothetical protein L2E82_10326 [Cichorium intybus]
MWCIMDDIAPRVIELVKSMLQLDACTKVHCYSFSDAESTLLILRAYISCSPLLRNLSTFAIQTSRSLHCFELLWMLRPGTHKYVGRGSSASLIRLHRSHFTGRHVEDSEMNFVDFAFIGMGCLGRLLHYS